MQPSLPPIQELNALDAEQFVAAMRPLFEAADPLARALHAQRPFASYTQLVSRAEWLVQTLPLAEQIQVVNAHPRIGESVERLSSQSAREQADSQDADEDLSARLAELNRRYEERFGFRFLVFVNRRPKSAILEVLKERLENPRAEELQTGLREMFLIARDRLRLLVPPHQH